MRVRCSQAFRLFSGIDSRGSDSPRFATSRWVLSIIAAHVGWVPVNSVTATKASSSTSASTNPSHNGPFFSTNSSPTSSMPSTSPNSANIPSSTCTSKDTHLIIAIVTLVVKDFPWLSFAAPSPSVPLISSPPSLGSEMGLPSSSEISPAPSSGSFSSTFSSVLYPLDLSVSTSFWFSLL